MKKLTLILCCLISFFSLFAQDTAIDKQLIKHNQVQLCAGGFICNNRVYPFCELQNKFVSTPEALKEYKKYKSDSKWSNVQGYFVLAGIIGGIATLNSNNNISGKIMLSSLIPIFLISPFIHPTRHLNNAVTTYNKQF